MPHSSHLIAAIVALSFGCPVFAQEFPEPSGPWKDLQGPRPEEDEAWTALRFADLDGTPEQWNAIRPLLERNRELVDLLTPTDGAFALELPPTLFPETSFPDLQPLRHAVQLQLARSRLAALDGNRDAGLALLDRTGRLADALLVASDGVIPLINAVGAHGDWLDACLWHLRDAQGTSDQRAVRAHILPLLRARRNAVRRAVIQSILGEVSLFERVVDRMPEPFTPMTGYLDAFSVLAQPTTLEPVTYPDPFGLPQKNWFAKDLTKQTMHRLTAGWLEQLSMADRLPVEGSYSEELANLTRAWEAQAGALLPYLHDYSFIEAPMPWMPSWMLQFNQELNPLGNFLVSMMASPFEALTESAYRREAQRRALILLATGEVDPVAPPQTFEIMPIERVDPFNGESLRIEPVTLTIWSVGPDRTDNEGREGDLVWTGLRPSH